MSKADRWHWSKDENGEPLARIVPALETPLYAEYIDEGMEQAARKKAVNESQRPSLWNDLFGKDD